MVEYLSQNEEETLKIAFDFGQKITGLETRSPSKAAVVGLYGELGAGKTTFMKGLAKYFGITETIQSPTFVIEKIYELEGTRNWKLGTRFKHLIHIDAYRIEKGEEMISLGWNEIVADSKNLICIEWPERIADIIPEHIKINFEHISENERKITIK